MKNKRRIPFFKRLGTKLSLSFLISSLIIIILLSVLSYIQTSKLITGYLGNKALNLAKVASEHIDKEEFKNLKTENDEKKDIYQDMREELNHIREVGGAKYLYTMRKTEDGKFMYVVDGMDYEDVSHIGETEKSSKEYEKVIGGKSYVGDKIEDAGEWGVLINSYYPIKDNSGEVIGFVGVDYDAKSAFIALKRFRFIVIIMAIIMGLASIAFGIYLSRRISKPIENISNIAEKVANYDLDVDEINVKSKGEIGLLSSSFNKMLVNMREMISKVKESGDHVFDTSVSLNKTIENTTEAIEGVADTVEEVALATNDQAKDTEKAVSEVNTLSDQIDLVDLSADKMDETADKTKDFSKKGLNIVKVLTEKTNENNKSSKEVNDIVLKVNESTEKINLITETINGISEQTNLLALNASIEAARAGEVGKGFAVVAEEIRKLAVESSEAVNEIDNIVKNIQANSNNAVDTIKSVENVKKEQNEAVKDTEDVFKEINNSLNELLGSVEEVKSSSKTMSENKSKIVTMIENISATSEETSAATEEVSASTEEQLATMEEISSNSRDLERLSKDLEEIIEKFNI
ncbi:MAG: methyl-accepting chemotaxis protein [Firmicutes bacterium]|nr:methyl-accepting chemotaxis protein [Bacillota bacterium]